MLELKEYRQFLTVIKTQVLLVGLRTRKGQNPISEGIVIEASGVPPGGINLLYSYIDHTSGTRGTDQVNATQNGQSHMMGFSSDVDNGYYPGDKVTVSVSKYVPKVISHTPRSMRMVMPHIFRSPSLIQRRLH